MLFGSRARADARPDSDYEVVVFLRDFAGRGHGALRTGAVINALPFKAGAYEERAGLMQELRREGRDLKPETQTFLAKAWRDLAGAKKIVAIGLEKVAARSANYSAFHAAEAPRATTSASRVATPNLTML